MAEPLGLLGVLGIEMAWARRENNISETAIQLMRR